MSTQPFCLSKWNKKLSWGSGYLGGSYLGTPCCCYGTINGNSAVILHQIWKYQHRFPWNCHTNVQNILDFVFWCMDIPLISDLSGPSVSWCHSKCDFCWKSVSGTMFANKILGKICSRKTNYVIPPEQTDGTCNENHKTKKTCRLGSSGLCKDVLPIWPFQRAALC